MKALSMVRWTWLPLALSLLFVTGPDARAAAPGPFSILQGATDKTSTQLAIVLPKNLKVNYTLRDTATKQTFLPTSREHIERPTSDWAVEQIQYSNLTVGIQYRFEVVGAVEGEIFDSRLLKTLDVDNPFMELTVLSCMKDTFKAEDLNEMSDALIAAKSKVYFFIGDNVYASTTGPVDGPKLWQRYVETRQRFRFFYSERLVPTFAVWDDHDYGDNDGNGKYAYKNESKEVFESFFAQKAIPGTWYRGPGVSSVLKAFGQIFFFMDGRFFRGENGRTGAESQWGVAQEDWLFSHLAEAKDPVWIINGTQFFAGYFYTENYIKDFKDSFKKLMETLAKIKVPIMFMSGDIHFSENMKIPREYLGYATIEVTSSGFLSSRPPVPIPLPPNKKRVHGAFKNNFITISPVVMNNTFAASIVTAWGKKHKRLYRDFLMVVR